MAFKLSCEPLLFIARLSSGPLPPNARLEVTTVRFLRMPIPYLMALREQQIIELIAVCIDVKNQIYIEG